MKRIHLTILLSALFMVMASAAQARFVFEPIAYGERGGFSGIQRLWDTPPTISNLPESGLDNPVSGSGLGLSMDNLGPRIAVGYVDFGIDFSQVQITELWTAYRSFSPSSTQPFADLWWADSSTLTTVTVAGVTTVTKEVANTTDITDPAFNFGINSTASGNAVLWTQDAVFMTPVVPERRFLMFASSTASNTNSVFGGGRATELAIVAIPEASSLMLGLVALGTVFLLKRRK